MVCIFLATQKCLKPSGPAEHSPLGFVKTVGRVQVCTTRSHASSASQTGFREQRERQCMCAAREREREKKDSVRRENTEDRGLLEVHNRRV